MIWTRDIGLQLRHFLAAAVDRIIVICPYVQDAALRFLLDRAQTASVTVITTWEPADLTYGASDVRIYNYLKQRRGTLCLHPNLHMKLFVADDRCVLSTANVSARGLGLQSRTNIECAHEPEQISREVSEVIESLLERSTRVCDRTYEKVLAGLTLDMNCLAELSTPVVLAPPQTFALSSLPLTRTPTELLRASTLIKQNNSRRAVAPTIALRDLHLFNLDFTQSESNVRVQLRSAFLSIPLVSAFAQFVLCPRYFGEVKRWLQEMCTDKPQPSRKALTPYVQALFGWLKEFSPACSILRLRHSERIQMDCTTVGG